VDALPGDPREDNALREVRACYSRVRPTPVAKPELLALVPEVVALLGGAPPLDVLAGNALAPGSIPYAACYGGHQFGTWAGQLGDGRAITLGEVTHDGATWELQLKGAGPTPYSRRADGRAVLRSSLRELVCSEAMHHLGVPTTRALSLVATGEPVMRDMLYDGNPRLEPGAVVCRVAPTFLRFGSFEIHAARGEVQLLDKLVAYTRERFFAGKPIAAMFEEIALTTAHMVSEWLRVGFVHGVMNTDNMSILGLTIDYGPYGWLESFDLDWTPNTTDASGRRYRYGNQAAIAHWNVAQLGRALAQLVDDAAAIQRTIDRFPRVVADLYRHTMLRKLGLTGRAETAAEDDALLASLSQLLLEVETDMTLFFRGLASGNLEPAYYTAPTPMQRRLTDAWLARWEARREPDSLATMAAVNPLYVPRNYLVQEVIEKVEAGDRAALPELLDVLRHPYTAQPGRERFAAKRPEWARHRTGCSMLSCSS
jgi:serine/tyrosine/threonine adenylyltransferase